VGESPTVLREIQVRSRGSSYTQVCTQFIQEDIPMDPDRWCPTVRSWGSLVVISSYPHRYPQLWIT